jgi:hypothetical protein
MEWNRMEWNRMEWNRMEYLGKNGGPPFIQRKELKDIFFV